MNAAEMIQIHDYQGVPSVSAKQLHEALGIRTRFRVWISRMFRYGFKEDVDYQRVAQKCDTLGGMQECSDYYITVDMAKQICMLQRTDKGKLYRQYFLDLERAWNTPEQVYARALQMAQASIEQMKKEIGILQEKQESDQKTIEEMKPKVHYVDLVLQSDELVVITQIAKDYGMSATVLNRILHRLHIQYRSHGQWVLYSEYQKCGYAQSVTLAIRHSDGSIEAKMHTQWTQKGRLFLYEELKKIGYLPVIEQEYEM